MFFSNLYYLTFMIFELDSYKYISNYLSIDFTERCFLNLKLNLLIEKLHFSDYYFVFYLVSLVSNRKPSKITNL